MPTVVSGEPKAKRREGTESFERLLFEEKQKGIRINLISIGPGSTSNLDVSSKGLIWFQMLKGDATLRTEPTRHTPRYTVPLTDVHSITLRSDFKAALQSTQGAIIFSLEILDLQSIDPESPKVSAMSIVDWTLEPAFHSTDDARKRVVIADKWLCSTAALRGDVVLYPAGFASPGSQRLGASTFLYLLGGPADVRSNGERHVLQQGDLIVVGGEEQYSVRARADELRLLQLSVPGEFKTVWADPGAVSKWVLTEYTITGRSLYQ